MRRTPRFTRWTAALRFFAAALTTGWGSVAMACSPVPGYVRPSNFELTQIADTILIASPIEMVGSGDGFDGTVRFKVSQTLKGPSQETVDVHRMRIGRTLPSPENDVRFSHPEGHAGPCNRMTFEKGHAYLLFLSHTAEGYRTPGYPFSRESEDYTGESSTWPRVVRVYLDIQTLPPMAQVGKLADMRAAILSTKTRSPYETALAEDIQDHLGSVSPWKPTEFLVAAYNDHKAGKASRFAARDRAFDTEQSEAEALTEAMMEKLTGKPKAASRPTRSAYETRVLEALIEGDHPTAAPIFEQFSRTGVTGDDLALAIRFLAKNGRYPEAFALIESRAAEIVEKSPQVEAGPLLQAVGEAVQDPFYGEGEPRWRSDPASRERWPKLALRLTSAAQSRFGFDPDFDKTLESILGTDYRANPELTLALSGKDNGIGDWAQKELMKAENLRLQPNLTPGGVDDPLRLPLQVTLRWQGLSGDEDVPALIEVFCTGSPRRRMVFEEWGRLGSQESVHTILRLAASSDMTAADLEALAEAIPRWDRRYQAERGESWLAADKAMQKLARREPISAREIKPLAPARCRS